VGYETIIETTSILA